MSMPKSIIKTEPQMVQSIKLMIILLVFKLKDLLQHSKMPVISLLFIHLLKDQILATIVFGVSVMMVIT